MNGLAACSWRWKPKRPATAGSPLAASQATGIARSVPAQAGVGRGLRGLADPGSLSGEGRRPGGGRPTLTGTDPDLLENLRQLVDPAVPAKAGMGDPMRPLMWVSKSHAK